MLTPGRYVGAANQEEESEPFEQKMKRLVSQLRQQQAEAARLDAAEEMKTSEARQREALSEAKGEVRMVSEELKGPGDKLDRVIESLLPSRV